MTWLSRMHVSPVFKSCQVVRPPTMHDPNDKTCGCLLFNDVMLTGYFRIAINTKSNPDIC